MTLAVCERRRVAQTWWRRLITYREEIEEAHQILVALMLGAACHRPARAVAYGQQRLLEIALALASRPKVVLLDEPAAGVPREESKELLPPLPDCRATSRCCSSSSDIEGVFVSPAESS